MATKPLPPQSILLQLLRYEPDTGQLFWKERRPTMFRAGRMSAEDLARRWNAQYAGKRAAAVCGNGYLAITIDRQQYLSHRVIWKMVHGEDPDNVDHINGARDENHLANLRNVIPVDNHRNKRTPLTNTSGTIGVWFDARRGKWVASITVEMRSLFIGRFNTFDEAVAARKAAEVRYGFHPNHGRN